MPFESAQLPGDDDNVVPFFEPRPPHAEIEEAPFDNQFQDFCLELHRDPELTTTTATIAAEYQRLFLSDRTWVLMPTGHRWSLKAVSGIPNFQRRAEVVQKLEQLVTLIGRTNQPFQWSAGESTSPLSTRVRNVLDQYLDEVHVCRLRIEPLLPPEARDANESENGQTHSIGIVVCEWFQPPASSFSETRWTAARNHAGTAIQNAFDWSQAPLAQKLRHWRRTATWHGPAKWAMLIAAVAGFAALAALIPMEFTINAVGEMKPVRQRHVFATSTGIVRAIAVSAGRDVSEGTTLLELDSPELELEIRRTDGDLRTTEKKIASLEASRLDFGLGSSDSTNQMNTLGGELKEQLQRRDNLRLELDLLHLRRDELKVVSPINGRVVTWDLEQLLAHRPVSRGQRLLTISDTEGPWELELRVADEDTSDLVAAMQANKSVPLDFVAITKPDMVHSTTLRSISDTVEIRSQGEAPTVLCRADLPGNLKESAVEGMSVRGRIHCGRRAAIVVLLDKFWRSVREHILFPLGW